MALKDIVEVNITRQTTSVAVAAFNVPLILSTFASGASGTPSTFTRAKSYGSAKALADDGWSTTGTVYKMANAIFSQNPTVNRIVVGRADSNDATVAASLNAICGEENSWYGLVVDPELSFSAANWERISGTLKAATATEVVCLVMFTSTMSFSAICGLLLFNINLIFLNAQKSTFYKNFVNHFLRVVVVVLLNIDGRHRKSITGIAPSPSHFKREDALAPPFRLLQCRQVVRPVRL